MSGKNQGEADNVTGFPTEFRFDDSIRPNGRKGRRTVVSRQGRVRNSRPRRPSMTVSRLDEDQRGKANVCTPGGQQQMLTVSKSGLYSLIFTEPKA